MKKTDFSKPQYSVAMAEDTGCVVILEARGSELRVIGSLTHEQSIQFADGILKWMPAALRPAEPAPVDALN